MSGRRSVSGSMIGLMASVCGLAIWALQLTATPQVAADAPGVTVTVDGAQMAQRTPISYPWEARSKGVTGEVVARLKIDGHGNVSDANILDGPNELRRAVLVSVLNWRFDIAAASSTRTVSVRFSPPPTASPGDRYAASATSTTTPPAGYRASASAGSGSDPELLNAASNITDDPDPHLRLSINYRSSDRATLKAVMPKSRLKPLILVISRATDEQQTIRVGSSQSAIVTTRLAALDAARAKAARVSGAVSLEALIGKDGIMRDFKVLNGDPRLVTSAVEVIKGWNYRIAELEGLPQELKTYIDISF